FLAGIAFAAGLFLTQQRLKNPLVTPVAVILGIVATHVALAATGTSIATARDEGWLFPALAGIALPRPVTVMTSPLLDWSVMAGMARYATATAIAVIIGMLLNLTGIETATDRAADVDHELRWHGIANALAALAGGSAGNITLSRTSLNMRCGGHSRLSV